MARSIAQCGRRSWVGRIRYALGRALGVQTASLREFYAWARQIGAAGEYEITRPMAQNVHVYRAVTVLSQTIASLPAILWRSGSEQAVESGPAYELIKYPDRAVTWEDLAEEIAGQLVTSGAAFVVDADLLADPRQRLSEVRAPRRLAVIGQKQMRPHYQPGTERLLWWDYYERGASRPLPIPPEFAPYIRLFNPDSAWTGLSPLDAALLGIRQDYKSAAYNVAALDNGGQPGGLYVFAEDPGEERRAEFLRMIEERHGGPGRAMKPGLLWGAVDYKETAKSMIDLALIDGRKLSREEIFEAFGVPPVLGCVWESAHYQVGSAAQQVFVENTVKPLARKIAGLFNVLILPAIEPGVRLELDLSVHPIVQELERAKIDSWIKLVRNRVPARQASQFVGLPFEDIPHADVAFTEAGLITVNDAVAGLAAPPEVEEPLNDEEPARAPVERLDNGDHEIVGAASITSQRREQERLIRAAMPAIGRRFRAFFARQEHEILRRLRKAMSAEGSSAADQSAPDADRIIERVLLEIGPEQQKLRAMVRDYLPEAMRPALRSELERLGIADEQIKGWIERLLRGRQFARVLRIKEIRVVGIDRVTRRRVREALMDGLRNGETIGDLSQRVHAVMAGNRARTLTIARTEAGQAVSTGQFIAAEAASAGTKAWIAGANPRPTHVAAGARYAPGRGAIGLQEAFSVGSDLLMYPRDPAGSPGEIINCNCVMITGRAKRTGIDENEAVNANADAA